MTRSLVQEFVRFRIERQPVRDAGARMPEWSPKANEIFLAAIEIAAAPERARYVDEACAGDLKLREAVDALLRAAARAEESKFLESGAATGVSGGIAAGAAPDLAGTIVGNYKLVERIGEGGFGVVYSAQQLRPVQRMVAVKIVKPGMDSARVIARFEAERQALALMDHPNIAKVFDAGTTDWRTPYFVMELVSGEPITKYCDQQQLTPRQRLELFIPVCQAVQHAHQKGIIHRDLKPSNVLVALYDGQPLPKVIDFGIAKAMESHSLDRTIFTEAGSIVGTPEYMAPEQAELNNTDIDTRADIYSLGVILYELLAGSPPFSAAQLRSAAFDQMLKIIRETDPVKPSTRLSSAAELPSIAARRNLEPARLTRLVHGELDWIVMKALDKDRSRRYETANGLSMDLQRYLADEPVVAAAPSAAYRLRKFVRRHKGPVIAASAIALALFGGIIGTTWGLLRAETARKLAADRAEGERVAKENAQQREVETRAVLDFVETRVFAAARPAGQEGGLGHDVTLRKAIDAAIPFIEKNFANQPLIEAKLRRTIGRSLMFLGDRRSAVDQWEKARALLLVHRGADHPDTLMCSNDLANGYDMLSRSAEAARLHEETLAISKAKLGPDDPRTLLCMMNLANSYDNLGQEQQAQQLRLESLALQRAKLGPDHPDTLKSMNNLAVSYKRSGRYAEALELRQQTLALRRAKLGADHPDTLGSMQGLANSYYDLNRFEDALKLHQETLELMNTVLGPRHPETLRARHNIAKDVYSLRRYEQALPLAEESLALRRSELGPTHGDTLGAMNHLANVYEKIDRKDEALKLREETLALRREFSGPTHPETLTAMNNLGISYDAAGRHDEALKLHEQVVSQRQATVGENHPDTLLSLGNYAVCLVKLGRGAEAIPLIDRYIARIAGIHLDDQSATSWVMEHRLKYFQSINDPAGCRQTAEMWEKLRYSDAESLYLAAKMRSTAAAVFAAGKSPDATSQAAAEADLAVDWLKQAVAKGYGDLATLETDPAFAAIRSRPEFVELLAKLKSRKPPPP